MKKFILSLGLIAMAFSLTNCAQSSDDFNFPTEPAEEFALYAVASRTTNDGVNTLWKDGDDLSVFHAVASTTEFVKDEKFTLDDATTGFFKGALADGVNLTEAAYDWYVTYPYYSGFTKPGTGYYNTVGCTTTTAKQTQNGNNSSAHICGKELPLIGVVKGVAANKTPEIKLRNAASIAKFEITNKLNEPISIKSIEMTAEGYHLVGQFYIKFAQEPVAYNPKANSTLSTALLEVKNGESIAAGKSATFYMAVAPFTLTESSTVSFKVVAQNESNLEFECIKDAQLAKGWGFTAGEYKNITFGFELKNASISATTDEATDTESSTGDTATLNGSYATLNVSDNSIVTCGFEWKSSNTSYTSVTAENTSSFSYALTGLTTGTEYTYRAWASLDGGTTKSYGEEKSFTTKKSSATAKSYTLSNEAISSITDKWSYTSGHTYTYIGTDNSEWVAYESTRSSGKALSSVQIKKDSNYGYLASPIVNGKITKVVTTIENGSATNSFTISGNAPDTKIYTSANLAKDTIEYTITIDGNYSQIFIRSGKNALYIKSVTIYYE